MLVVTGLEAEPGRKPLRLGALPRASAERDFRNDHLIHPSTAILKCPLPEEGKHSKPPLSYSIPELPDAS